ncbi:hypothetical protein M378DRAFT_157474 [Amanita muscaria Koide BX008]|uniref:Uncharacterized protein n=1 Tax=Amanita muscaria (strain Koide BX008) TaxID=946122 RepID=A0A0C2XIC8_AMAMK|nr:hypothetical protein M378DRAFT_157474 [Amanita muscaria Koide BX008]
MSTKYLVKHTMPPKVRTKSIQRKYSARWYSESPSWVAVVVAFDPCGIGGRL